MLINEVNIALLSKQAQFPFGVYFAHIKLFWLENKINVFSPQKIDRM